LVTLTVCGTDEATTTTHLTASSRAARVSLYQKGITRLDLNEAGDDGVWGWQWHQLDYIQKTPTPHLSIFTGLMLFLTPNQQCQSTEGQ